MEAEETNLSDSRHTGAFISSSAQLAQSSSLFCDQILYKINKMEACCPFPPLKFCSSFNQAQCKALLHGDSGIKGHGSRKNKFSGLMAVSAFSYQKFVHFALTETKLHTQLAPSPLQDKFGSMKATDDKTILEMLSFKAPKIRLLRSLTVEGPDSMQVLDFAVFPEPQFDLPIFCANFFTCAGANIVVLDLNPLYDVTSQRHYKEKYYRSLMPLGNRYAELLPWGGKITSESLKFFSPIVLWTKFSSSEHRHTDLFAAFIDYYKAWLKLMDQATEEVHHSSIISNTEAQHRYLTWRAEKDPGQRMLNKLMGQPLAKSLVRNFLFHGINELGKKTFLDYFPEYQCEDGTINEKRSIIGKSFESRPWDIRGEFIVDNLR